MANGYALVAQFMGGEHKRIATLGTFSLEMLIFRLKKLYS